MDFVSDRIRELRKIVGLSQGELAKKLGVTRGHISNLETGQAAPSDQLLRLLSELFLFNFEWLKNGTGNKTNLVAWTVQKNAYEEIASRLDLFLNVHKDVAAFLVEAFNRWPVMRLSPEFCPDEVLEKMRQILNIPDEELFELIREKILDWGRDRAKG